MNCRVFKDIPTITEADWRAKHKGHRITESWKRVKGPGYVVVFARCEDCRSTHGTHEAAK